MRLPDMQQAIVEGTRSNQGRSIPLFSMTPVRPITQGPLVLVVLHDAQIRSTACAENCAT